MLLGIEGQVLWHKPRRRVQKPRVEVVLFSLVAFLLLLTIVRLRIT
jgi:hypothetical protein